MKATFQTYQSYGPTLPAYLFAYFQIYVEPPLQRCQPYWYSTNYSLIVASFANSFKCPERILILPNFDCSPTSFNVDGVHLTQGEGERYYFGFFIILALFILIAFALFLNTRCVMIGNSQPSLRFPYIVFFYV
jgi:hypothetical protein